MRTLNYCWKKANVLSFFLTLLLFAFAANQVAAQANDNCAEAIALECGDVVTGNNENAVTDEVPSCGLVFPGQSVWYTIEGTGADITVSTCSPNTNFDTQLAIFSGSCGALSCVTGNNNDTGCANPRQSTVTWASEAGTTYYILVAGVLGADGDYELSVTCEAAPIVNDDCEGAIDIGCGDVILGSTEGASNTSLSFCGTSLSTAPGVWYHFTGTGDIVEVTTCGAGTNYDTKLGVFSGSCGSLTCVGGDDDEFGCGFSSLQSLVSFNSVAGTDYYIYVTGFGTNSGSFELSLTCTSPVANDNCSGAIAVDCGEVVSGSTTGATNDSSIPFCGTSLTSAEGVWYSVLGTGGSITVSTCNAGTNYDSKLGVFSGSCGSLNCVGGDDDDPACSFSSLRSTVTFDSEEGATYYIYVTGFGSSDGNFELSVECEPIDMEPSTCDNATELFCDDVVTGNTNNGFVNEFGPVCGTSQSNNISTAPGVWYTLTGDGSRVTLSTCSAVTDFDSKIAVLSGSCGDFDCVASNDNGECGVGGRNATVSFIAEVGVTYYIYVTGHQGANGNFELSVSCVAPNDDCADAIAIECGETVEGSNSRATPDSAPFCGTSVSSSARGVWYTITGNGNELTASLCGSDYDTKLFVYEGACEALSCVAGNDDFCGLDSQVSWDSEEGVTYYILVSGFSSSSVGNYILSIPGDCGGGGSTCNNDGIYDDVCDADCLTIGETYSFSNAGATAQPGEPNPGPGVTGTSSCNSTDGWCSFELDVDNSVWFQFTAPESGCVNIDVLDADLQLAVWTATDCSNFGTFVEVAANDDSGPGLSPALEGLAVTPGEIYWVQVDGYNGALETAGTITVSSCEGGGNVACSEAPEILCGESLSGTTVGAPVDDGLPFCGTSLTSAGGVWYRFIGTGDNVTVSTCNPGTDYDTKLGIFTGSCDALVCVGGNDDQSGAFDPACDVTGIGFNRGSTVSFGTMSGQEYYIYVTGFSTNTGNFELSVDCDASSMMNSLPESSGSVDVIRYSENGEFGVGELYPNPAQYGVTNVQIFAPVEAEAQIQLFDQVGRLAQNLEIDLFTGVNTVEMDVAGLPVGTYYAIIRMDQQVFNKKLVIAR